MYSALNLKRTVMKMETVCGKMKSMRMNQEVMETFGNLSAGVASQMAALDMVKMADNVHLLNEKMDDVLIKAKMMD